MWRLGKSRQCWCLHAGCLNQSVALLPATGAAYICIHHQQWAESSQERMCCLLTNACSKHACGSSNATRMVVGDRQCGCGTAAACCLVTLAILGHVAAGHSSGGNSAGLS